MQTAVHPDRPSLGKAAAHDAATALRTALAARGTATLVVATGASQFDTLSAFVAEPGIDWGKVTVFHLDEYVGLDATHPASFRRFLLDRFVNRLPTPPAAFHQIDGRAEPEAECRRLAALVPTGTFDVATIGIGENAHLAFNDPPADFTTTSPYLVVALDEACRQQQVGEGWFASLADVPTRAISMSVRRILATTTLVCSVPDERKAAAVRGTLEGPITPDVPASILREHPDCRLHLDRPAASLLRHPAG
jgi:glucosamine-6-phosphate deaminase